MNPLKSLRVEKSGAVSHQQYAISVDLWHREISTGGNRLGSVTDHLSTLEQSTHVWMLLESLKLRVRIEQRILVIESGNVADVQNAVLQSIDPTASISIRVGRKSKRVGHSSGWITVVRQLPKLFDANAINLWFPSFIETETLNQLFS